MNKKNKEKKVKISAMTLRQFTENRRIANIAVQKAIEENQKFDIPDELAYSK